MDIFERGHELYESLKEYRKVKKIGPFSKKDNEIINRLVRATSNLEDIEIEWCLDGMVESGEDHQALVKELAEIGLYE